MWWKLWTTSPKSNPAVQEHEEHRTKQEKGEAEEEGCGRSFPKTSVRKRNRASINKVGSEYYLGCSEYYVGNHQVTISLWFSAC
jgi:hypothetical protein